MKKKSNQIKIQESKQNESCSDTIIEWNIKKREKKQ